METILLLSFFVPKTSILLLIRSQELKNREAIFLYVSHILAYKELNVSAVFDRSHILLIKRSSLQAISLFLANI